MNFELSNYIKQQLRDMKAFGVLDYIENLEGEKKQSEALVESLENAYIKAQEIIVEQKAHCKAVDEVNVKLRCCENCKNHYFHFGHELDCRLENDCELDEHGDYKYDKWEMAE